MCTRARASNCLTLRNWSKETVSRFEDTALPVGDRAGETCPARHGGSESGDMNRLRLLQAPDWSFSSRVTFYSACPVSQTCLSESRSQGDSFSGKQRAAGLGLATRAGA